VPAASLRVAPRRLTRLVRNEEFSGSIPLRSTKQPSVKHSIDREHAARMLALSIAFPRAGWRACLHRRVVRLLVRGRNRVAHGEAERATLHQVLVL
jgi:hypothetical protein